MARGHWFKHYANKWLGDYSIRSLSDEARSFLMDARSIACGSSRRGYLVSPDGKPMAPEAIAKATGRKVAQVRRLIQQCLLSGSLESADGILFSCPEIVYQEKVSAILRDSGKKGWERKTLKGNLKGNLEGGLGSNPVLSGSVLSVPSEDRKPFKAHAPPEMATATGVELERWDILHAAVTEFHRRRGETSPIVIKCDTDIAVSNAREYNNQAVIDALMGAPLSDGFRMTMATARGLGGKRGAERAGAIKHDKPDDGTNNARVRTGIYDNPDKTRR